MIEFLQGKELVFLLYVICPNCFWERGFFLKGSLTGFQTLSGVLFHVFKEKPRQGLNMAEKQGIP